jgi:flagella basal body P-ring formation protein FlgA
MSAIRALKFFSIGCLLLWPVLPLGAQAQQDSPQSLRQEQQITIIGRNETTVTTESVRLSDIAEISARAPSPTLDEDIIALKKLVIASSPAPGKQSSLEGAQILERMKQQGVALGRIGYSLPRVVLVKRAARSLSSTEIVDAVSGYLKQSGRDIALKQLLYQEQIAVPPGAVQIEALGFKPSEQGKVMFSMSAIAEGMNPIRFDVPALVDEWRDIPIAKRPLARGLVLGPSDVMKARLNLKQVPRDASYDEESLFGLELQDDISYGDFFRRNKLAIPAVIAAGSKVTLLVKSRLYEISAQGTALEAGILGDTIRVRNEASKKVVVGTVLEPGLVEVRP